MPVNALADLMKKLNLTVLKTLVKESNAPLEAVNPKKADYIDSLIDWAYEKGIIIFVQKIDLDALKKALGEAGVTVKSSVNSKEKVQEVLLDAVSADSDGPEGFLNKMELKTLKSFVDVLDFETDAKTKKQFADDIADEILLNGTRELFDNVKLNDIKEAAKLLGLKATGKRSQILDRILNEPFPGILQEDDEETETKKSSSKKGKSSKSGSSSSATKEKKAKPESKLSRDELNEHIKATRMPIEKGITKDDLYQLYWDVELKQFCVDNQLKKTGNKQEIIKRILAYLDDPNNKGFSKRGKKRKTSYSKPKKSAKRAKISKDEDNEATEEAEE
jgi:hypothetical protein